MITFQAICGSGESIMRSVVCPVELCPGAYLDCASTRKPVAKGISSPTRAASLGDPAPQSSAGWIRLTEKYNRRRMGIPIPSLTSLDCGWAPGAKPPRLLPSRPGRNEWWRPTAAGRADQCPQVRHKSCGVTDPESDLHPRSPSYLKIRSHPLDGFVPAVLLGKRFVIPRFACIASACLRRRSRV